MLIGGLVPSLTTTYLPLEHLLKHHNVSLACSLACIASKTQQADESVVSPEVPLAHTAPADHIPLDSHHSRCGASVAQLHLGWR